MKISVILAHPKEGSFNHAIANTVIEVLKENGHEVIFHDLYQEQFEPLISVAELAKEVKLSPEIDKHCHEIAQADGIIIIHPNWWGQPPAILKGWIDRVIRPEIAYHFNENDSGEGIPEGLLKAKSAIVFNTSDTDSHREQNFFLDPLETIWKNCIFKFCGVTDVTRRMFGVLVISTEKQRQSWLSEVREIIVKKYPLDNT